MNEDQGTRLYRVVAIDGTVRLIQAGTKAAAMRYAARTHFHVSVPTPLVVARDIEQGVSVEDPRNPDMVLVDGPKSARQ